VSRRAVVSVSEHHHTARPFFWRVSASFSRAVDPKRLTAPLRTPNSSQIPLCRSFSSLSGRWAARNSGAKFLAKTQKQEENHFSHRFSTQAPIVVGFMALRSSPQPANREKTMHTITVTEKELRVSPTIALNAAANGPVLIADTDGSVTHVLLTFEQYTALVGPETAAADAQKAIAAVGS